MIETQLTPFIIDSIKFVLESYDSSSELVSQIQYLELIEKEHTTVGCYYSFAIKSEDKLSFDTEDNSILGDGCTVYTDEIGLEASLLVWIENGKIDCLEILSNTCDFPSIDPRNYHFKNTPVNYIDLR